MILSRLPRPGSRLLLPVLDDRGGEGDLALLELDVERPVFLGDEAFNLFFALADEAERDGLHASGRKAVLHLLPEQRRKIVADQPVEHSPRLLRVDLRVVDVHRILDRFADGIRA